MVGESNLMVRPLVFIIAGPERPIRRFEARMIHLSSIGFGEKCLRRGGFAVLALIAASNLGCSASSGSADPDEVKDKSGKILRTAEVQSGTFRVTVTATGKVKANLEVQISSKASGEILELPFDAGDPVKKGDLLVRLDPDDESRSVRKMEAKLQSAIASRDKSKQQLEVAKSDQKKGLTNSETGLDLADARLRELRARYERQKTLFEEKLIPKQELEILETLLTEAESGHKQSSATLEDMKNKHHDLAAKAEDVKLAEVEVSNAKIALEEAQERLAETQIRAPMDGVITSRKVEPGYVISSAMSNFSGGTLLLVLSDLSRLFVVAAVDEADIGGIDVGQTATVRTDSFPGETFEGKVFHISPVGVELNSVVNFDVKIEVTGEGLKKLRPGMTADATILTGIAENTLWVQGDAIEISPQGRIVKVLGADKVVQSIPVETGLTDGILIEIRKGITAGQKVIIPDLEGSGEWSRGRRRRG